MSPPEFFHEPWFKTLYGAVQRAAEEGDALNVFALLSPFCAGNEDDLIQGKYTKKSILQSILRDDDENSRKHHYPPMAAAAYHGHKSVVEVLLQNFSFSGFMEFEYVLNLETKDEAAGLTALWLAASNNSLEVVQFLLQNGAMVDHATETGSTPLRAACWNENLELCRILIKAGANVNAINHYGNSCLMLAAYKKNSPIMLELIDNGADVNMKDRCGNTALHFAVAKMMKTDHKDVFVVANILITSGAKNLKNRVGQSPLLLATECYDLDIILPIFHNEMYDLVSEQDIADAWDARFSVLTLKMSSLTDQFWKVAEKAFVRRHTTGFVPQLGAGAYDANAEVTSVEDLRRIETTQGRPGVMIQGLLTSERIWGESCPSLTMSFQRSEIGKLLLQHQFFDNFHSRVFAHGLQLADKYSQKHFSRYYQWLLIDHVTRMARFHPDYPTLTLVIQNGISFLRKMVSERKSSKYSNFLIEQSESPVLLISMGLLIVAHSYIPNMTATSRFGLSKLVYDLAKVGAVSDERQSALMLSVCPDAFAEAPINRFHKSPCEPLVSSLIEFTDDLDARDRTLSTALHYMSDAKVKPNDREKMYRIVVKMLARNAHPDITNANGQTPEDLCLRNSPIKHCLRHATHMSLQCLAATAVRAYDIPYRDVVHRELAEFCNMHGRRIYTAQSPESPDTA